MSSLHAGHRPSAPRRVAAPVAGLLLALGTAAAAHASDAAQRCAPGEQAAAAAPRATAARPGQNATVLRALRQGGVNLVFGWYDVGAFQPTEFDDDLPVIRAGGAGHVRLAIGMEILEEGTTGTLREDRWAALKQFVAQASANGLVTIVDLHNTSQKNPDGTWSHDYMRDLADPPFRERHLRLVTALACRMQHELDLDQVALQPANEPIFKDGPSLWYDHQDRLVRAIQAVCPGCVTLVMAHEWQGIGATMRHLKLPRGRWRMDRIVVDVHFYEPLELTHCNFPGQPDTCGGKTWPGHYTGRLPATGGKFTGTWTRAVLAAELAKLWAWRRANGNVAVHFSEIGTAASLADDVRAAYLGDLVSLLRSAGVGWTCWEWDKNFGVAAHPRTRAVCLGGPEGSAR